MDSGSINTRGKYPNTDTIGISQTINHTKNEKQ